MANLSSSVSAHAGNDEAPKLDDFYFETYIQAWPLVEKLLWGDGEIERARAQKAMRRINTNIEQLNRHHGKHRDARKIDVGKYTRIGEKLLKAAIDYLTTGNNSEYIALREKYNDSFESRGFPDDFCIHDDDFDALCRRVQPMVQKAREDHSSDSSDLRDVPDEEHADAEQYTDAEQNNNRREELENAYTTAGLDDHDSLPAEEYDPQEPGLEPADATDEVDDEYDDDGFLSRTPQGPSPKDRAFWETHYVSFDDLLHDTQKVWGSLMTEGEILAYRLQGTVGYSVIVGYECDGHQIARLEAAARRPIPKDAQHIAEISKARKPIYEDKKSKYKVYRNRAAVQGIGLIAWRVEGNYEAEPTSVLRPSRKAWYPETYIQVYWADNTWSWESRDGRRFVYGGDPYKVDILIYRQAISQEADFKEALTGHRPEFPDGGPMANKHWRNENAFGGAYWLQPRARKNKRVVKIEEEELEDVKSEDEDTLWRPPRNGAASQPLADESGAPGDLLQESPDAPSIWQTASYDSLTRNRNTQRNHVSDFQNLEAERRQGAFASRLRTGNTSAESYQGTRDRGLDTAHAQETTPATRQTPYEVPSDRSVDDAPLERRRSNTGPTRHGSFVNAPHTPLRNINETLEGRRPNRRSGTPPNAPQTPQGNNQTPYGSSPRRNVNNAPPRRQSTTTARGNVPPRTPNIQERRNLHTGTARHSEPPISASRTARVRETNTARTAASQHRTPLNTSSTPAERNPRSAGQTSFNPSSTTSNRNRAGGAASQLPGRRTGSNIPSRSRTLASRGGSQIPIRNNLAQRGSSSRSAQPASEGRRRVKVDL